MVENGAAMIPKALVKMAVGLPNVLFAAFFAFSEIDIRCLDLQFKG